MKLQTLQENLSKALTVTSRFASSKVQLPVLANVLLSSKKNKLLISATNLEISVCMSIGAKVDEEGEITIPSRTITDLVTNLNVGQIELSAEKEQLKISAQNFSSTISGMNSSDFPSVPQEIVKTALQISREIFLDALSQVLFAVSIDETRPVLTGVLLIMKKGQMTLVSTDGFRLSQKRLQIKTDKETTLILPRNVLSELSRLSSDEEYVNFSFKEGENQAIFGVTGAVLASRIIEGEFPDFERILPKSSSVKVALDKEEFLRAVKLASVFARDSANVIKLTFKAGSIEVSAESSRSGSQKTQVDAKVEGETQELKKEGFEIAFNYRFLEDFLNVVKGDEVKMEFSGGNSPGVFLDPQDPDFLHIIMPVRIQG